MSVCPVFTPASPALASFHLVQIEQVIGGVNGDTSAQAIQLRLRSPGEHHSQFARIRAWDAAGENPIIIIDFLIGAPSGFLHLADDEVLMVGNGLLRDLQT